MFAVLRVCRNAAVDDGEYSAMLTCPIGHAAKLNSWPIIESIEAFLGVKR